MLAVNDGCLAGGQMMQHQPAVSPPKPGMLRKYARCGLQPDIAVLTGTDGYRILIYLVPAVFIQAGSYQNYGLGAAAIYSDVIQICIVLQIAVQRLGLSKTGPASRYPNAPSTPNLW